MNQQNGYPFTVTSQQETARPVAGGQVARGMLIAFRTATGQAGSVFVEDVNYNVDYVRSAIIARAMQIDAVQSLQG